VHAVQVVSRVLLGAVFVLAGVSKIAASGSWPAQAAGLGVPRSVAVVVPWIELTLGAIVIVGLAMPTSAIVAVVLLVVFTAVLLRSLAAGLHPPCACFGAWSASPIGWGHVARNAAFTGVGIVAIATG
jgi:uncharacterized membrane protein YphA (DoxX/SURF4 family)